MNSKTISWMEPKTMKELSMYWAWKALDLGRTITTLNNMLKTSNVYEFEIIYTRQKKISELRLIESLQKRHMNGEF